MIKKLLKISSLHEDYFEITQSAKILINCYDVKYVFEFTQRSIKYQSARGFTPKTATIGLIFPRGLRIDIFLNLAPGGKSWIRESIFNYPSGNPLLKPVQSTH